jgi:hypothetical protein
MSNVQEEVTQMIDLKKRVAITIRISGHKENPQKTGI